MIKTDSTKYFDHHQRVDVGDQVTINICGMEHVVTVTGHEVVGTWFHRLRHYYKVVRGIYYAYGNQRGQRKCSP